MFPEAKTERIKMVERFLSYLERFIGVPYVFGGNSTIDKGLDCSGFVLEGLRSIGKWGKSDATAQQIFLTFCSSCTIHEDPQPGDLLFFGQDRTKITHIAVCLNDKQMIEAGGNNTNGMVRLRPLNWRSDGVAILRMGENNGIG